ncbi:hypothetical protein DVH24_007704, partial [Malus domestica]
YFFVTSQHRPPPYPGLNSIVARYCPLWAPYHALMVLFLGTHTRTSQWVTHHGNALARTRLTLEFLQNPKPVSSQKAYMIHFLSDVRCNNPPPLGARSPRAAHYRPEIGSDTELTHPSPGQDGVPNISDT